MVERRGILVHPEELDEIWLDDIHKANINVLGLHPVGGTHADQTLREAIERHNTPAFQALLEKARELSPSPSPRELDALLATGECASVALGAILLCEMGVPAVSLSAAQLPLRRLQAR